MADLPKGFRADQGDRADRVADAIGVVRLAPGRPAALGGRLLGRHPDQADRTARLTRDLDHDPGRASCHPGAGGGGWGATWG